MESLQNNTRQCRTFVNDVMILTSSLPALLHPILVDVQREQHVRVAPLVLIHVGPACAARSNGRVQEEGGFLRRWGAQLTLVLELPWRKRRRRSTEREPG